VARARLGSIVVVAMVVAAAPARAAVSDWRLSEVLPASAGDDPAIRYIELYTAAGACWFATTRLAAYDGAGASLGVVAPFVQTTCFGPDTYLLIATPVAQAAFSVTAESGTVPPLPRTAGQLCLVSSATPYDCVRWGAVTAPVHDLFGPDDDTAIVGPAPGIAMVRVDQVHVVTTDWAFASPTPRGPNDGTPWIPPDAGPPADAAVDANGDAGALDAAGVVDARPPADAAPRPDAANHRYLDLDPGGGACACRTSTPGAVVPVGFAVLALSRRRRRASSGRSGR
jgi:hypothetical protein